MFSTAAWSQTPLKPADPAGQLAVANPAMRNSSATQAAAVTTPASGAAAPGTQSAAGAPTTGLASPLKKSLGCVTTGNGYLRAKIRGALKLDVDYHDSELECDGGARPDGSGFRVSFAGPPRSDGRRLRMVFGIATATEGIAGKELPTNLTVIFEGEQRVFATRGDDKCTVDQLSQERVGALGGASRQYRVIARGFCISPVSSLSGQETILINSFDFAGNVTFEDAVPDKPRKSAADGSAKK
jgi:hypothetical protein